MQPQHTGNQLHFYSNQDQNLVYYGHDADGLPAPARQESSASFASNASQGVPS